MSATQTMQPRFIEISGSTVIKLADPAAKAASPPRPHRFADAMETALTGVVFTGVLLFAAALLRDSAPLCTLRIIGDTILTFGAIVAGSISVIFVAHGVFGK